jgi:5'-nucleotidase
MLRRIRTAIVALVATAALVPLAAPPASAAAPKKLTILVTNDDGVSAPGIDALVTALKKLPNVKVTVVAPLSNQSGTGDKTTEGGPPEAADTATASGVKAQAVDGFPADSVLRALDDGVKAKLVVSGINQGQNLGPVVNASGTVGAAKTAVRNGIPALAVSQGIVAEPDQPDYATGVRYAIDWVKQHRKNLTGKKPTVELVNLNVPTCLTGKVRGLDDDVASATAGDAVGQSDCNSTATGFTDDVQAFNNGYATLTVVPAT